MENELTTKEIIKLETSNIEVKSKDFIKRATAGVPPDFFVDYNISERRLSWLEARVKRDGVYCVVDARCFVGNVRYLLDRLFTKVIDNGSREHSIIFFSNSISNKAVFSAVNADSLLSTFHKHQWYLPNEKKSTSDLLSYANIEQSQSILIMQEDISKEVVSQLQGYPEGKNDYYIRPYTHMMYQQNVLRISDNLKNYYPLLEGDGIVEKIQDFITYVDGMTQSLNINAKLTGSLIEALREVSKVNEKTNKKADKSVEDNKK